MKEILGHLMKISAVIWPQIRLGLRLSADEPCMLDYRPQNSTQMKDSAAKLNNLEELKDLRLDDGHR